MPTYQVEDAKGRVLELEGDHEPSQDEAAAAFASTFPEPAAVEPARGKPWPTVSAPGTAAPSMAANGVVSPLEFGQPPSDMEWLAKQASTPREQALSAKLEKPLVSLPQELYEAPMLKWLAPGMAEGMAAGVKQSVENMTSPAGLATLPYMAVGGAEAAALKGASVVGRLVAGAFGAQSAAQLPEAGKRYVEAVRQGDQREAAKAWVDLAANSLIALGGAEGVQGLKRSLETPPIADRVAPATSEALKSGGERLAQSIPPERQLTGPAIRLPETPEGPIGPEARGVAPESHQLRAPSIDLEEYPGGPIGPEARTGPLPESRQLLSPRILAPEATPEPGAILTHGAEPGEVITRISLPAEPETARIARQAWSTPIDVEAQVTGADALRQLATMTEERKTPGQPYQAPTVNVDLRQLERMMQRNTIDKVESWADETIQGKLRDVSANPYFDPEFLAAAAVKSAILVKRGVTGFAEWSGRMKEQFGPGIESHLPALYDQATKAYGAVGNRERAAAAPMASPAAAKSEAPSGLIDQTRIKTAIKEQDVLPGRDWWASPEFEFRNDPVASSLVTHLNEAELDYKARSAHASERMDALAKTLSPDERLSLTKALFAKEADASGDAIAALPEAAQKAAAEIRATYDNVRARVIEDKQQSVVKTLSPAQQRALYAVQDGVPLEEAARASKLRDAGKAIVKSAADELKALESWGVENYTTHIERGSHRVVTEDGVTVAIAETRAEAAIKADRWLKENPEVKSLTLTDEFNPGAEFPTKLSRGQYFRLIQRLKDGLGEDAAEIQSLLRKHGSIVAVKPTDKYAGPMRHRRNILKGEENVFDALSAYTHSMEKKLALDPVLRQARKDLPTLSENTRAQIEDLFNDVKGRKTIGDKISDALLEPFGLKPFSYSRSLDTARQVATNLKLGYRPVAAIVNRASGMLLHTWTKLGTRYLQKGRAWLKTPEGQAALAASEPYIGIEAAFGVEAMRSRAQEPLWKPLGMFQAAERYNRPEAFASFYKYAEGELGLKGEAAAQYARNATRFGQFTYNTAALPRALRGPTGRFVFQFKPYLVKELEFISSLRGAEIPRYLVASLTLGGPRALLYTLKSLPLLGAIGALATAEDWLNRKAPAASRGVGGALGVDVSPAVAFQFPTTASELLGPTVSDATRLWTDVIGPALQGEDRDWSDVGKWAMRLAPALNYWGQLVEAATSESGSMTDKRGRPGYKPTKLDYAKLALGAKPLNKSIAEIEDRFLRQRETIYRANRTRLIDDFLDASDKKDGAQAQELAQRLAEMGVGAETVKAAAKGRHIEPKLRLLRSLSKGTKAKEAERFAPASETP